jgi:acetyltransferase-like isoleucine patch superfamily enzyme
LKKIIKKLFIFLRLIPEEIVKYKIGNVKYNNSRIDSLIPEFIEIGDNFISAPGSIILAHDASLFIQYREYRVQKTIIGDNVFLGANAVVLAGVTVGDGAIIGAGSVVTKDVVSKMVVAGNPAREISTVEAYRAKCQEKGLLVQAPKGFNKLFENKFLDKSNIDEFKKVCFEHTRD